jgi:hypothetical protein
MDNAIVVDDISDIKSYESIEPANIILPSAWKLYSCNKYLFKKMTNKNVVKQPTEELYDITTLDQIIYIIKLLGEKNTTITNEQQQQQQQQQQQKNKLTSSDGKLNMDTNEFIIMRSDVKPLWEDPKNINGGTFTIILSHDKGFELWQQLIMSLCGETLMKSTMSYINGISVSYILKNDMTYLKIWDGYPKRTVEHFSNDISDVFAEILKNQSIQYSANGEKKNFNKIDFTKKNVADKKNNKGFKLNRKKY